MDQTNLSLSEALLAALIGLGAIYFKIYALGIILIGTGIALIGIDPKLRDIFLKFIKLLSKGLYKKEETLSIERSQKSKIQKSGGDIFNVEGDINYGNSIKEKTQTSLKIYYDKNETYHRVPIANISPIRNGLFLHVMVRNEEERIAKDCYGELIEVQEKRDGTYSKVPTFTAPVILKWAHEDIDKKIDIDNEIPRRLDICHTIEGYDNLIFMTSGGPRGIQTQFPKGKYKIKVRVRGENTEFSYGEFLIDFDGNWRNIKINTLNQTKNI